MKSNGNIAAREERYHRILKNISSKTNVIEWLQFEIALSDIVSRHVSHNASDIPRNFHDIDILFIHFLLQN